MSADAPFAGRYRLLDELGVGGAGTVWRAEDLQGGGCCAVKVVAGAGSESATHRRMVREASVLADIEHPHLVRVLDWGTAGDDGYLAMELVDGPNLHELVESDGPVAPERAVSLVLDLLSGLEAAHQAGVVHRDVKPSNVLVGADGRARLSDFGIARADDGKTALTKTGTLLGTYAFAAPEQLEDPRAAGPQADVYAAGATLAFLVTGRMPFGLHDTARQEELLADLPEALGSAIRRAVSSLPGERPDGAAGLARALRGESEVAVGGRRGRWVAALAVLGLGLIGSQLAAPDPVVVPDRSEAVAVARAAEAAAVTALEGVIEAPATMEAPVAEASTPPLDAAKRPVATVERPPERTREPEVAEAEVAEGPDSSEDAGAPPPLTPVRVVIQSMPYSEVFIDGRPFERTPVSVTVEPGPHNVLLETSDGRRKEQEVAFREGMPSPWCWDFDRNAKCSR